MNNTIRAKLFKWNITMVLVVLMCTFISVQLFSENIYKLKTIQLIQSEASSINNIMKTDDVDTIANAINESAFRLGGTVSLYSGDGTLLFVSNQTTQGMGRGKGNQGMGNSANFSSFNIEEGQLLETQTTSGKELLTYKETLDDNNALVIQLPKEKIDDALWVFEQLLLYVAVVAIIIAVSGSFFMSKHFSQPIVELKNLAENIATLNFDGHYAEERSDEIGQLGDSLNMLSNELKDTIDRLKAELSKEKTMDTLRTQFVAQASHELQTPLTVIRNYIEALEDNMIKDEELPAHLEVMQDEINGMSHLVNGLLDLSQLRSGEFSVTAQRFDITSLVKSEIELFKNQLEENILLEEMLYKEAVMIYGDPIRIKQAIRNLVTNGLKHSDGGITIKTLVSDGCYQFEVENTGAPIKDSEIKELWEVFYKEEGNHKKGTGLGLAIIKAIIDKHNGTYGIENTEKGVRSYFNLNVVG